MDCNLLQTVTRPDHWTLRPYFVNPHTGIKSIGSCKRRSEGPKVHTNLLFTTTYTWTLSEAQARAGRG